VQTQKDNLCESRKLFRKALFYRTFLWM